MGWAPCTFFTHIKQAVRLIHDRTRLHGKTHRVASQLAEGFKRAQYLRRIQLHSNDFCDYVEFWKHNGFWFFDSFALIRTVATENEIDHMDTVPVYYRGHETQFDAELTQWTDYADADSRPQVIPTTSKTFLGYDIVTYSQRNSPQCSPLSCNHLATDVVVNEHCFIDSLDCAIEQLGSGVFNNLEPGPYGIIAVNSVGWPDRRQRHIIPKPTKNAFWI